MKIAVELQLKDGVRVFRGIGTRGWEDGRGKILRIKLDAGGAGSVDFIIEEDLWTGKLLPDTQYNCDYILPVSMT
jgi:hypothetical protein